MFKPIQALATTFAEPQSEVDEDSIRHVFKVLHGFYGNLFLSKWTTGTVENGEDQGIANARRIWAYSLREHQVDDIKLALRRCQSAHPEYPPSLPQFLALCDAITPRAARQPQALPAQPRIEMSDELREQIRAENRRKASEAAHRAKPREPEGLDLLKLSIADAVRAAGGDDAKVLLQLDRIFTPRGSA